jgi:hypothetical protein
MIKAKAAYEYDFDNDVLFITDLSDIAPLRPTVTNDIENILHDIGAFENRNLSDFKIMYRDTGGVIDGVQVDSVGRFVAFFAISQSDYQRAKEGLMTWHKNETKQSFDFGAIDNLTND